MGLILPIPYPNSYEHICEYIFYFSTYLSRILWFIIISRISLKRMNNPAFVLKSYNNVVIRSLPKHFK